MIPVVLLLCLSFVRSDDPHALIEHINTKSDWNAEFYPRFSTLTKETASSLLNFVPSGEHSTVPVYKSKGLTLPKAFDSRQQWPNCSAMFNPLDQGQCGSCWAFGCVKSLSQRFCVATNASFNLELSEQQMVSCNLDGAEACGGGDPITAFRYAAMYGLPLSTCVPYVSGKDGSVPSCTSQCNDGEKWKVYSASGLSFRWHLTLAGIMESIYTQGPVEACFQVYQDFMNYKSGVYHYVSGDHLGGHCVVIVGWGTTPQGVDYWIVQNSWSKSWGMDGFFWIQRGVDECGNEWEVYPALPSL